MADIIWLPNGPVDSYMGVWIQWNGMVDWNGGMDWNGMVEWNGIVEWNGTVLR